ncbi:hypothetical protein [Halalkalibacter akibai]|uniref:Phosphate ABC transporter permease subunit PstC n=1 Tax=Halalkalibacter akibai (strain ATCC 43226 / DSM 21942 / CIP 109018 / JCM 9157 / 1139) TaxID=1236973 RepID=W4QRT1_HALA3|nr:hypothetical protein [Halalkalibacter akibai]GAE34637.1 hypothetical protein JCM9157_1707 [Halalkalibacter akibai JCM 9157]
MDSQIEEKKRPEWLKWTIRVILGYAALLALILAVTIIAILITFTFIVIDSFSETTRLGLISEQYLVPVSEFMWKLFTWLIPGL